MKIRKLKKSDLILVTQADRTDACDFYEKYGFQKDNKSYKKLEGIKNV